jgi:flagellar hook-associated protein 2
VFNVAPTGLTSEYDALSEVGIKTNRDGTLSLDATVLDTALKDDFEGVAQLFANDDQGYAFRLEALADDFLDIDGVIDSRTDGLDARIKDLTTQKSEMEYRLDIVESRLRKQFTTLDVMVMQMQSTSSYLAQQLANLPKPGG